MKKLKLLIVCIVLILINNLSMAQEKTHIERSNDTTTNQYDKMLKYFVLDKTEVKQLFKTDLFQIALKRPNISYERKISKKLVLSLKAWEQFIVVL